MKTKIFMIHFVLLSLTINVALSQENFSTKKIAVFKNGTGFYVKSGNISVKDNVYVINQPPTALFGSIWISSENNNVKGLHSLDEKSYIKKDVESIRDMLEGNVGKKVTIFLYSDVKYEGAIIKEVKKDIVTFKVSNKWITAKTSEIRAVEFLGQPNMKYNKQNDLHKISVNFNENGDQELYLMYMQKGIGWFPGYLIELSDNNMANIQLRATLINDNDDIKDAELSFVVGVPNFKFSYVKSPLTSVMMLDAFIKNLNSSSDLTNLFDNASIHSNMMGQSMDSRSYSESRSYAETDNTFFGADINNQEDLYFYKQENINLKKGERATMILLKAQVPFEHIYEVNLKQNPLDYSAYYNDQLNEPTINNVWHSVKLKNTTSMPWTTGNVFVTKKTGKSALPICQDLLKYTPVNTKGTIKVTISPDISVTDTESEVERKPKNTKRHHKYYDLVNIEGKIKIKNHKDKEIKLNIKRNIIGHLNESSVEWKFTKLPALYYYNINATNKVNWEIKLKPGEEKVLKYAYNIYVSS